MKASSGNGPDATNARPAKKVINNAHNFIAKTMEWTELPDKSGSVMTKHQGTWPELLERIRNAVPFPSKEKCPWIKMATFGDIRSVNGSLRTNKNLNDVFGIEGDYDAELVTMVEAISLLEEHGIRAAAYPSPSSTAEKPRWRVLCPLAERCQPGARKALVARLNGALGGILAGESFTVSQGFFFGDVGTNNYRVLTTFNDPDEGTCIDELDDLDFIAWGKNAKPGAPAGNEAPSTPPDERHAALVKAILTGEVYHASLRDLAASMTATGMQAGAVVNHLRGLMDASIGPHDDRWKARKAQIPDLVSSAGVKFAPLSDEDFDDMVSDATDKLASDAAKEESADAPKDDDKATIGDAKKQRYNLLTVAGLQALPPLRWRIRDVLPESGLGMIVGASTAGKTFIGLDMAAHISLGLDWFGHKTAASPVVYIGLEGERGIQRRITAWESHNTHVLPDSFRFVLEPFNMLNLSNVADLAAAVLEAGGRDGVIFIDTFNRATPGGDENSSVGMGNAIAAAKKLQSATNSIVVLVHHKGKNDAAGARGHSSLYAALDCAIAVNRKDRLRSWSTEPAQGGKSKDGEAITKSFELKTIQLGVDDEGLPVSSAVVVASDKAVHQHTPLTPTQQAAMQAYFDVAGQHGVLDADDNFAGLHIEVWRPAVYATSTGDNLETKRKSFKRVRDDLVKLGRLKVINDVYQLGVESFFRATGFADSLLEKRMKPMKQTAF
jgi:hypothetical protein